MTTTTSHKSRKLAQLAEKIAAFQAEYAEREKHLDDVVRRCGPARVALVEDLLEEFDVPPAEPVQRRHKQRGTLLYDARGNPRMDDPDPDETDRMRRLYDAIMTTARPVRSATLSAPSRQEEPSA